MVFHYNVFNLLHVLPNGKKLTFADVALLLKKKPSTIRYAYFPACQKLGLTDPTSNPVPIPEANARAVLGDRHGPHSWACHSGVPRPRWAGLLDRDYI